MFQCFAFACHTFTICGNNKQFIGVSGGRFDGASIAATGDKAVFFWGGTLSGVDVSDGGGV